MRNALSFYEPQVAVLPDVLLQPGERTLALARRFKEEVAHAFPNTDWLFIPQAVPGDVEGWLACLREGMQCLSPEWIGIPRALATHIARDPLARVLVARELRNTYPDVRLHAFGMANGDACELPYLEQAGVESCDSSCAVWRGWNGMSITNVRDRLAWDSEGSEVDFTDTDLPPLGGTRDKIILDNLEACGVYTD